MHKSIAVAFLGVLISQAYCQLPQCACSVMDNCVQTEIVKKTTCETTCATTSLPTGGNKALQCVMDVRVAHTKDAATLNQCLETALGRPCTTARLRRGANNTALHHPGGFPGGFGGGFPGGFGGGFPGMLNLAGTAQTEMAAFGKCVFDCITRDEPKPLGGRPHSGQGRRGPGGPFGHGRPGGPNGRGPFYGACPRLNNCRMTPPDFRKNPTEAQKCINAATMSATTSTTEQTFCTCLQGAYSADMVACNLNNGK